MSKIMAVTEEDISEIVKILRVLPNDTTVYLTIEFHNGRYPEPKH